MLNEINQEVARLLLFHNRGPFTPIEMNEDWASLFIHLSLAGRSPQLTFDHMNVHGQPIYWAFVGDEENVDSATGYDAYGATPGEALCNAFLLACKVYVPTVTRRVLELIEDAPVSTPTWISRKHAWDAPEIIIQLPKNM